jgi:preprotein translocase subunit SecA
MIQKLLTRIFGSRNERLLRDYRKVVERVNALEPQVTALTDEQLTAKTAEFKSRVEQGEALDALLPEAFAVCREAARPRARHAPLRRAADRRHDAARRQDRRDAHRRRQDADGHAAGLPERPGGKGVHLVTVNDYLARRDAEWMGRLYTFLGSPSASTCRACRAKRSRPAYAPT